MHAFAVAPVVETSSINAMCSAAGGLTALKAALVLEARCAGVLNLAWARVYFIRFKLWLFSGQESLLESVRAIHSDWL